MTTNIVVGVQSENTIKIGKYGDSEQDSVSLGLIKGGVTIEHDETKQDIMVDQYLGAVDQIVSAESMKVKAVLAEAALSNIAYVYGSEVSPQGDLSFGDNQSGKYYTLYINVKGANGKLRKYTFWKCALSGKTSQTYRRDGETVVETEFNVLIDTTKQQGARFGQLTEE
ncbi:hypothetical protein Dip518_000008 [Parelusimicrobium proximum]|uniref:hypothetical protein n=1 Tax=Parelusimicrobium proximum TaxID=3228953 RepID=UPI003D17444C